MLKISIKELKQNGGSHFEWYLYGHMRKINLKLSIKDVKRKSEH